MGIIKETFPAKIKAPKQTWKHYNKGLETEK